MCFKYVPPDPDDDGPALDTFFANVLKNLPERIERQRKRREVRRMLAQRSKELLGRYRRGEAVGDECPLKKALRGN